MKLQKRLGDLASRMIRGELGDGATASMLGDAENKITALEDVCGEAYAMIENGPASIYAKEAFLDRIRRVLGRPEIYSR